MIARTGWLVRCHDYTSRLFPTLASAERFAAQVVESGHCRNDHEVVEVNA